MKLDKVKELFSMGTGVSFFRMLSRGPRRFVYIGIISVLMLVLITRYGQQSSELTQRSTNAFRDSPTPIFTLMNRSEGRLLEKIVKNWKQNMRDVLNGVQGTDSGCRELLRRFGGDEYVASAIADVLDVNNSKKSDKGTDSLKQNFMNNSVVDSKEKPKMRLNTKEAVTTKNTTPKMGLKTREAVTPKSRVDNHTLPKATGNILGANTVNQHIKVGPVKNTVDYHTPTPLEKQISYYHSKSKKQNVDYNTKPASPKKENVHQHRPTIQNAKDKQEIVHHTIPTSLTKKNVSLRITTKPVKQNVDHHSPMPLHKNVKQATVSPYKQNTENRTIPMTAEKQLTNNRTLTKVQIKQHVYSNATSLATSGGKADSLSTKQINDNKTGGNSATSQQKTNSLPTSKEINDNKTIGNSVAKPKIMLWLFKTHYHPTVKKPMPLPVCPKSNCRMTTNWDYYHSSSAILFSAKFVTWKHPPPRLSRQIWILHNHESPKAQWVKKTTFKHLQWRSLFNWTMGYRKDSDIVSPYGILTKRTSVVYKNYSSIVSRKLGPASWLVSNCHAESGRNDYVTELKKHLKVKVFGLCGEHCSRRTDDECLGKINNYKFYLAFENAFCRDYVTEKFFRWYTADVVLVVRGGADYKRDFPQGTFINTADYPTVKDLANYLNYLDKHDEKYIEYLKRKDEYDSVYEDYINSKGKHYIHYHYEQVPLCEVCDRLWNLDRYKRTYDDIGRWFDQGFCYIPGDI